MKSRKASKSSSTDLNLSTDRPGGETTGQENILFSKDWFFAFVWGSKLPSLVSTTGRLLADSATLSCSQLVWAERSTSLDLPANLSRFGWRAPATLLSCFLFCPDDGSDGKLLKLRLVLFDWVLLEWTLVVFDWAWLIDPVLGISFDSQIPFRSVLRKDMIDDLTAWLACLFLTNWSTRCAALYIHLILLTL